MKPKGTSGAEIRPLDDVDGHKKKLVDLIAYTLVGSKKMNPFSFVGKEDTTYQVDEVKKSDKAIFFTVTQGSKGIESRIIDGPKLVLERKSKHIENINYRNVVVFPKNGKYAILLTERIGTRGVASFLSKILVESLRQNLEEATVEFKVLTTAADLQSVNLTVQSMEFSFPTKDDPSGKRMDLRAPDGKFSLKYKFRGDKKLSSFTNASGKKIDPSKVFGVLNPPLLAAGLGGTGESLKGLGVSADLHVTLPSGNTRTFTLGSDEGPALAYKLEAMVKGAPVSVADQYPTETDFVRVAKEAMTDVVGTFGVTQASASHCEKPQPGDFVKVPKDWKVVWSVPDHIAPAGA